MLLPPSEEFFRLQEALVGRYSLQREIGRGGMGIVYLAHDVALDRPVALKLLPPDQASRPSFRERFLREARTAAKLSHPNIVPIHAVEELGEFVFYVMAYVEGETLKERVARRGPMSPADGARVLREVAWALAYAHAHGVVHRDVKPDNVLLDGETGRALVMDFGIAQVIEADGLTGRGEILGTAEFMSPEQASGEAVDERTDVYAMGVLGHYVLAGRLPFQAGTMAATLAQHLTRPAPPLASVAPHVPADLARTLDRCLEKDREARFANGERLAEELSRTLEARRSVPVPLRSFIEQSQDRFKGIWGWVFVVAYMAVLSAVLAGAGVPEMGVLLAALSVALAVAPVGLLARMTRALQRAGYGREDLTLALQAHVEARREERDLELGAEGTWMDRIGYAMVTGGVLAMATGTGAAVLLDLTSLPGVVSFALGGFTLAGFFTAMAGLPVAALRMERGKRIPGERWLRFWKGKLGGWLFEASGLKLPPLPAAPGYRPTEMMLGSAADRLFEELPRTTRRELEGLPSTIQQLEADAVKMRTHVGALDRLLGEVGRGAAGVSEEERARLRRDLEGAREAARTRLGEAVSALETIRLGLLRLHAGEGTVEGMTAVLGSAQEVSEQISRLVEGQDEVRRLLEGEGE